MPAKRHGRAGKAHRPPLNESPLDDVARDPRAHPAMKALAALAAQRGLSLRGLAKLAGREPESLMRSFYATSPHLETVELVCDCLRLERRVARALLDRLDSRDAKDLRRLIAEAIEGHGRQSFGPHVIARKLEVLAWLERQPASVTLAVGRHAVLALHSLGDTVVDRDLATLPPVIGSTVTALRANGYNVFPFVQWRQSADAKATLALEAQVWANLLCEALGFEERYYFAPRLHSGGLKRDDSKSAIEATEVEDSKAFHRIVGPHLSRARDFIQAKFDTTDPETLDRFRRVQERLNGAQRAAKQAFLETLYSSESENQP